MTKVKDLIKNSKSKLATAAYLVQRVYLVDKILCVIGDLEYKDQLFLLDLAKERAKWRENSK